MYVVVVCASPDACVWRVSRRQPSELHPRRELAGASGTKGGNGAAATAGGGDAAHDAANSGSVALFRKVYGNVGSATVRHRTFSISGVEQAACGYARMAAHHGPVCACACIASADNGPASHAVAGSSTWKQDAGSQRKGTAQAHAKTGAARGTAAATATTPPPASTTTTAGSVASLSHSPGAAAAAGRSERAAGSGRGVRFQGNGHRRIVERGSVWADGLNDDNMESSGAAAADTALDRVGHHRANQWANAALGVVVGKRVAKQTLSRARRRLVAGGDASLTVCGRASVNTALCTRL